jgi:hypothetical protein
VRATPFLFPSLRTPARPGFGVFGHGKSTCFDRSLIQQRVSPELTSRPLPNEYVSGVANCQSSEQKPELGFERVQIGPGRENDCAPALFASERRTPDDCDESAVADKSGSSREGTLPKSFERVQTGEAPEVSGCLVPYPIGLFERVQITSDFTLMIARKPSDLCSVRRRRANSLGVGRAFSAPARHHHLTLKAPERRIPMPPQK